MMVLGGETAGMFLGHVGETLMNGISTFKKEPPESSLTSYVM